MRICGVDPGLRTTGYGVISGPAGSPSIIDAGVIRSTAAGDLAGRLSEIFQGLDEVLAETRPEAVAVENVYSHYNHPQTAVLMGHARGVVLLAAARHHIRVAQYSATHIKRSLTGNGRASKAQVQQAIAIHFGLVDCPQPNDVADALAIALCAAVLPGAADPVAAANPAARSKYL